MNKKSKLVAIIIFIVVLVFPCVSYCFLFKFDKKIDENRELASFPNSFLTFPSQFDNWFSDHLPFRSSYIKLYKGVQNSLGKSYENILNKLDIPYYNSIDKTLFGKDDWLFYLGNNELEYYRGTNLPSQSELENHLINAQKVYNYFASKGKKFVIYVAPNKSTIYSEFMPKGVKKSSQTSRVDLYNDYFKQHGEVPFVYAKDEIISHKDFGQLYFKYDTHWNNAGVYFGIKPLYDSIGLEYKSAELLLSGQMAGDLCLIAGMEFKPDTNYHVNFKSEINIIKREYNANDTFTVESDNRNGKHLVVIGDSYRISMIDFLGKEYETSIFDHRDAYSFQAYYDQFEEADTIILEAVERFEGCIWDFIERFVRDYNL